MSGQEFSENIASVVYFALSVTFMLNFNRIIVFLIDA